MTQQEKRGGQLRKRKPLSRFGAKARPAIDMTPFSVLALPPSLSLLIVRLVEDVLTGHCSLGDTKHTLRPQLTSRDLIHGILLASCTHSYM